MWPASGCARLCGWRSTRHSFPPTWTAPRWSTQAAGRRCQHLRVRSTVRPGASGPALGGDPPWQRQRLRCSHVTTAEPAARGGSHHRRPGGLSNKWAAALAVRGRGAGRGRGPQLPSQSIGSCSPDAPASLAPATKLFPPAAAATQCVCRAALLTPRGRSGTRQCGPGWRCPRAAPATPAAPSDVFSACIEAAAECRACRPALWERGATRRWGRGRACPAAVNTDSRVLPGTAAASPALCRTGAHALPRRRSTCRRDVTVRVTANPPRTAPCATRRSRWTAAMRASDADWAPGREPAA